MKFWGLHREIDTGILGMESSVVLSNANGRTAATEPSELPSFFVVGPPRTGTSWLHEVLSRYTNLPAPTKETRFFDCHYNRGWKWYQDSFSNLRPGRLMGEVAPTYFSSPEARERIAMSIPHAKLIFVFREPVGRVVSLYRMKRAYGMVPWSFEEALERDPELLESAKYATYLKAWQEQFPQDQLYVTLHDDLRKSPQSYIDGVSDFLGIPRITLTETELGHVHSSERMTQPRNFAFTKTALAIADWCKARKLDNIVAAVRNTSLKKLFLGGGAPFPEMSVTARHKLAAALRPEVEGLETLIRRDLGNWKTYVNEMGAGSNRIAS
jgi:hypothetical protein